MPLSRTVTALSLALVISGAAACTYKPRTAPINTGAGTVNQARQYLQGNWSLLSFTIYDANGAAIAMKGTGTLIYDDFNNMTMTLQARRRHGGPARESRTANGEEQFSTKGKTIVDMQNKTLRYVLEGQ